MKTALLTIAILLSITSQTQARARPRPPPCETLNAPCGPDGSSLCVGHESRKRCVKPMPLGGPCAADPYWICAEGLTCSNRHCVRPNVPPNGNCLPEGSVCPPDYKCVGRDDKKKCKKPMPEGGRCETDPFWVCEDGLRCVDKHCVRPRVPKRGNCAPEGAVCEEGTVCAGREGKRRKCVKPMPVGGRCGKDPYWVCEAGVDCLDGRCVSAPVPPGGDCLREASRCAEGYICAGREDKKKCKLPMPEGGKCETDPFWVCAEGLHCVDNVCVKPPVRKGGACNDEGAACVEGTVCAGREGRRKCVVPMARGGKCGTDPYWICGDGLQCIHHRCRDLNAAIAARGRCDFEGAKCEGGTKCAMTPGGTLRCMPPLARGQRCSHGAAQRACGEGLTCVNGFCKAIVQEAGASCAERKTLCRGGLRCVGGTCREALSVGALCGGMEGEGVCDYGLRCGLEGRCEEWVYRLGDSCIREGAVCPGGSVCAGDDVQRRCVRARREGMSCKLWWQVCGRGATCVDGRCRTTSTY